MREVHTSHMIPIFWYRMEQDPIRSKFLLPEKSGMTHEQSFWYWYEILVPVLGQRTWVVCHGPNELNSSKPLHGSVLQVILV